MTDIKEQKKLIRQLRKIKKDTPKKTQARRDINAKIREAKKKIQELRGYEKITPEKAELIKKIYKYTPYLKNLVGFDLSKYTIEQLQKHLENIKRRR